MSVGNGDGPFRHREFVDRKGYLSFVRPATGDQMERIKRILDSPHRIEDPFEVCARMDGNECAARLGLVCEATVLKIWRGEVKRNELNGEAAVIAAGAKITRAIDRAASNARNLKACMIPITKADMTSLRRFAQEHRDVDADNAEELILWAQQIANAYETGTEIDGCEGLHAFVERVFGLRNLRGFESAVRDVLKQEKDNNGELMDANLPEHSSDKVIIGQRKETPAELLRRRKQMVGDAYAKWRVEKYDRLEIRVTGKSEIELLSLVSEVSGFTVGSEDLAAWAASMQAKFVSDRDSLSEQEQKLLQIACEVFGYNPHGYNDFKSVIQYALSRMNSGETRVDNLLQFLEKNFNLAVKSLCETETLDEWSRKLDSWFLYGIRGVRDAERNLFRMLQRDFHFNPDGFNDFAKLVEYISVRSAVYPDNSDIMTLFDFATNISGFDFLNAYRNLPPKYRSGYLGQFRYLVKAALVIAREYFEPTVAGTMENLRADIKILSPNGTVLTQFDAISTTSGKLQPADIIAKWERVFEIKLELRQRRGELATAMSFKSPLRRHLTELGQRLGLAALWFEGTTGQEFKFPARLEFVYLSGSESARHLLIEVNSFFLEQWRTALLERCKLIRESFSSEERKMVNHLLKILRREYKKLREAEWNRFLSPSRGGGGYEMRTPQGVLDVFKEARRKGQFPRKEEVEGTKHSQRSRRKLKGQKLPGFVDDQEI